MNHLIKTLIDLCLFKIGPQDLPASPWLRNASLILYFLLGVMLSLSIEPIGDAIQDVLLNSIFLALLAIVPLQLIKKPERINQTLTAIYGCGVLFNIAIAPFAIIYYMEGQQAGTVVSSAIATLGLWNLAVLGNIIRHAFNLPLIAGLAIAMTFLAISSQFTH